MGNSVVYVRICLIICYNENIKIDMDTHALNFLSTKIII